MEPRGDIREGGNANDPLAKYPARFVTPSVPRLFALAVDQLFPPLSEYPGRRKALLAALGHRTSWGIIKHWRGARRPAPKWAKLIFLRMLDEKAAAIIHVAALIRADLENEKP